MQDSGSLLSLIRCVQSICQFRSTHYNFVKEYIIKREKKVIGSGGSNATSFVSNQLVVAYDYILWLCQHQSSCKTKVSSDVISIDLIYKDNFHKKQMLLSTLQHHQKSEQNTYKSIYSHILNLCSIEDPLFYSKLD